MRRRTVQYLVLLAVCALSAHLYFGSSFNAAPFTGWMDTDLDLEDPDMHDPAPPPPQRQPSDQPPGPDDNGPPVGWLLADVPKRDAVVAAFKRAWFAYERDAMGHDEYHPISRRGSNLSGSGGIGYTVVDALDTMLLMGLDAEYARAHKWVRTELTFDRSGFFSTFETTIRVLGGLLSAHHLTSDALYLQHATDLADRLLHAFDTTSGLPAPSVDLAGRRASGGGVSVSEATTLQLEFRYLAQLTGNAKYWHKAEHVMAVVNKARIPNGLAPISMSMSDGSFSRSTIRMGSNGDSYYEYLLKQYLQTDRMEPVYKEMYDDAMQGIHDHLVKQTPTRQVTYIAELLPQSWDDWKTSWAPQPKQEHLACFLAGSLMLGATTAGARTPHTVVSVPPRLNELSSRGLRDWKTGVALLEGCMDTHRTATGLSPEGVTFRTEADPAGGDRDWYINGANQASPPYDARYMLRPEIVESLFLAWRLTGDTRYRAHAWGVFNAIEKHCRLPGEDAGYATVLDVDSVPVTHADKQETFFLSETLKYLFLIFADEGVLNLDDTVFNTEAHPLPVFQPSIKPQFTKFVK
ncbi:glycoside hydrolase [Mycena sp. CBHHK59/15]|nr:glycoside hydrolase [Mycena sp. CBHHK59/15]